MLTILARVKILTDALASVASVWIRPCHILSQHRWTLKKDWKSQIRKKAQQMTNSM
jgi:hypothetical protein